MGSGLIFEIWPKTLKKTTGSKNSVKTEHSGGVRFQKGSQLIFFPISFNEYMLLFFETFFKEGVGLHVWICVKKARIHRMLSKWKNQKLLAHDDFWNWQKKLDKK